jgi:hypothetical protein
MAAKSALTAEDIKVGAVYRGKRFQQFLTTTNDRVVAWISSDRSEVQYDSDTVSVGRRLPRVSMDQFLRWVKCEHVGETE